jgi:uncharacterized phage protein (TIGR01671 family)
MREIKFRGYSKELNKWFYGDLVTNHGDTPYRIGDWGDGEIHRVAEKSLGQYTELKDKNGKEIYEGDIIRVKWENTAPKFLSNTEWIGEVFFNAGSFCINGEWVENLNNINGAIEVVGNIYENNELLKK